MGIRHAIIFSKLIFVLFFLSVFLGLNYAGAADKLPTGLDKAFDSSKGTPLEATAVKGGGFNTSANFKTIISTIITTVLSLMGVIFLILAIYSGFKWMTAAGNEEAVEKAKGTLVNAIIGIVVVLAAYAISKFVVEIFGAIVFK